MFFNRHMWFVWFKHTWLNILWLYNALSHDSSLVKKTKSMLFLIRSLNLTMVCGPILYMALSVKNKTVLVKILFFFVLFWIFFMHHLSFWGLFRVILIRDLKLYGWWLFVLRFYWFCWDFFPLWGNSAFAYLLINKHMKKSMDLHAQGTLRSTQQHEHPVCSWAHLTEQVVLLPGGHLGK